MTFIINSGFLPFEVLCFFGTREDWFERLKTYFTDDELSDLRKRKFKDGFCGRLDTKTILWLPKIPETIKELALLQHEIFHCANTVLEDICDLKLESFKTDEIYAYLIQHYTEQIYTQLNFNDKSWIQNTNL